MLIFSFNSLLNLSTARTVMSSRALRRLQRDSGIGIDFPGDEEKEEILENSTVSDDMGIAENNMRNRKKKGRGGNVPVNPFELVS